MRWHYRNITKADVVQQKNAGINRQVQLMIARGVKTECEREKDIFKYISSRSQMRKVIFIDYWFLNNYTMMEGVLPRIKKIHQIGDKPWILQAVDIKQHKIQRRFHLQLSVLIERFFLKNSSSDGLKGAPAYFRRVMSSINVLGRWWMWSRVLPGRLNRLWRIGRGVLIKSQESNGPTW